MLFKKRQRINAFLVQFDFKLQIKDQFVHLIERNTFLGRIVLKSSIKVQFVPLGIRNSEQLVPML